MSFYEKRKADLQNSKTGHGSPPGGATERDPPSVWSRTDGRTDSPGPQGEAPAAHAQRARVGICGLARATPPLVWARTPDRTAFRSPQANWLQLGSRRLPWGKPGDRAACACLSRLVPAAPSHRLEHLHFSFDLAFHCDSFSQMLYLNRIHANTCPRPGTHSLDAPFMSLPDCPGRRSLPGRLPGGRCSPGTSCQGPGDGLPSAGSLF